MKLTQSFINKLALEAACRQLNGHNEMFSQSVNWMKLKGACEASGANERFEKERVLLLIKNKSAWTVYQDLRHTIKE